jgi:hypothetical protein
VSTAFQQDPEIIDPAVDPERANALARSLVEGPKTPPALNAPPSNMVVLPGGYLDSTGFLHTECRIREITGVDEEAMAREMRAPNFTIPRIVDLILRRTVESVGTEPATPDLLGKLLVGDRSALLLAARIITFGEDWEVPEFPCRLCGRTFGVVIELDKDIAVRGLPEEARLKHEIDVSLRNGRSATVTLMTGATQLAMVGDGNRTMPEEQTIVIDSCIRAINGQRVLPPVAQSMGMADRHKIINALVAAQPGPQLEEVTVTCDNCQGTADYAISLVDLFR